MANRDYNHKKVILGTHIISILCYIMLQNYLKRIMFNREILQEYARSFLISGSDMKLFV